MPSLTNHMIFASRDKTLKFQCEVALNSLQFVHFLHRLNFYQKENSMNWLNLLMSAYPKINGSLVCVSIMSFFHSTSIGVLSGVRCGLNINQICAKTSCTICAESVTDYKFNNPHNWGTTYVFVKKKVIPHYDHEYATHMYFPKLQKGLWPLYGIMNNLILSARSILWRFYERSECKSKIISFGPLTSMKSNWNEITTNWLRTLVFFRTMIATHPSKNFLSCPNGSTSKF